MPTYQYRCAKCGEQFELWQSIHDDALQKHPGCGGSVTKVMAPAGIVLKGSGFYRTDSRKASTAPESASTNGSTSDKPAATPKKESAPSSSSVPSSSSKAAN